MQPGWFFSFLQLLYFVFIDPNNKFVLVLSMPIFIHLHFIYLSTRVKFLSLNKLHFLVSCFSDNTTKQKEDSDTEEIAENPEMSQNALFRAIQPTPSIISFVNENVIILGQLCIYKLVISCSCINRCYLLWQLLGRRREIDFRKAGYNIELPSPLDDTPFSTSSDRAKIEDSVSAHLLNV